MAELVAELICIDCGEPRDRGRRICKKCKAKKTRERYKEVGRHNFGRGFCKICNKKIILWRRDQLFCKECKNKSTSGQDNVSNTYERGHGEGYSFLHRRIAEEILGRSLDTNECVHHIDEDTNNNDPENLIVIERPFHVKLHIYLRRAYAELSEIDREKWKELKISITNVWIELTDCTIIRLNSYSQVAEWSTHST